MHKLKMDSIRWKCAFRLRDEIKRNAGADQHKNYPMLRLCVYVCVKPESVWWAMQRVNISETKKKDIEAKVEQNKLKNQQHTCTK